VLTVGPKSRTHIPMDLVALVGVASNSIIAATGNMYSSASLSSGILQASGFRKALKLVILFRVWEHFRSQNDEYGQYQSALE
jgi:hypothetical protein